MFFILLALFTVLQLFVPWAMLKSSLHNNICERLRFTSGAKFLFVGGCRFWFWGTQTTNWGSTSLNTIESITVKRNF